MVTFVTFFLWLMMGVHPVEVAVDPGVVSVEILLDGVEVGVATAPNWRVNVDFGKQLLPHSMVAVARDGEGVELGRAHQLVNMPRGDAEVEILLEDGTPQAPSMVRGFLKALGVPLVVWTTDREGVDPGWGEVEDVSTAGKLSAAARKLNQKLKRQWIVWVEGLHLPNRIELDSKVERIQRAD